MAVAVALLCLSWGAVDGGGQNSNSLEARRKAQFIGKMFEFVEWPAGLASTGRNVFEFCVVGNSLLGFAIAENLRGMTIRERRIELRSVAREEQLRGCEVVYISGLARGPIAKWLAKVDPGPVLTLGETEEFLEAGGMVRLVCENESIRFQVNLDAIRAAHLHMDARLLELAGQVSGKERGKG